MSYCHGLGREMAAEKIPRNTVGMVWKKGHKLARVSLHHVRRKYGYGIRGNWYLNFQKCCSQEQSGRKYRELLPSTSIKQYDDNSMMYYSNLQENENLDYDNLGFAQSF